jgi:hypothetical protein
MVQPSEAGHAGRDQRAAAEAGAVLRWAVGGDGVDDQVGRPDLCRRPGQRPGKLLGVSGISPNRDRALGFERIQVGLRARERGDAKPAREEVACDRAAEVSRAEHHGCVRFGFHGAPLHGERRCRPRGRRDGGNPGV